MWPLKTIKVKFIIHSLIQFYILQKLFFYIGPCVFLNIFLHYAIKTSQLCVISVSELNHKATRCLKSEFVSGGQLVLYIPHERQLLPGAITPPVTNIGLGAVSH
jgi:hypothetical protein